MRPGCPKDQPSFGLNGEYANVKSYSRKSPLYNLELAPRRNCLRCTQTYNLLTFMRVLPSLLNHFGRRLSSTQISGELIGMERILALARLCACYYFVAGSLL